MVAVGRRFYAIFRNFIRLVIRLELGAFNNIYILYNYKNIKHHNIIINIKIIFIKLYFLFFKKIIENIFILIIYNIN